MPLPRAIMSTSPLALSAQQVKGLLKSRQLFGHEVVTGPSWGGFLISHSVRTRSSNLFAGADFISIGWAKLNSERPGGCLTALAGKPVQHTAKACVQRMSGIQGSWCSLPAAESADVIRGDLLVSSGLHVLSPGRRLHERPRQITAPLLPLYCPTTAPTTAPTTDPIFY